ALGSSAGGAASCVGGLLVDGVWYSPDWYSPVPEERELGKVIGTVDGQWDCSVAEEELGDGVFASGIPDGSEVRQIGTRRVDEALATVSRDGVSVFRSPDSLSLTSALDDEIVAIGVNSDYDGTTRFATIDDPAVIARLVDAARAVDQETSFDGLSEGMRYFIEFVHADGLSTSFPYGVERAQLSDRVVGVMWAEAIDAALAQSGEAPTVEGLTVSVGGVDAPTHPLGSCRLDRTDLTATPGQIVTVGGEAVADDAIEPWWWINPPGGTGELVPAASPNGQRLVVPNVDEAMIVEIYLRTDATADVPLVEACFTLTTTGASARADGSVPIDSLDCTSQSSEPTVEQYDDGAAFPSIAAALTNWYERAAGERGDLADLQLVTTPYDPIANLVDAAGRSQAVIKLTGDGDASWRVSEAIICPKP
ncbi:MAG: hypothetical protein ACLGHQ_03485, partial [Acidimicrobiia bacterium]